LRSLSSYYDLNFLKNVNIFAIFKTFVQFYMPYQRVLLSGAGTGTAAAAAAATTTTITATITT